MMGRMERRMGVGRVEEGEKEGNEIGKWRRKGEKDRKSMECGRKTGMEDEDERDAG